MSTAIYSVTINRPLYDVVTYLDELDANLLPAEAGLTFESVRGGTRIHYQSTRGVSGFFKLADLLIRQITRRDQGRDVPELVFEP